MIISGMLPILIPCPETNIELASTELFQREEIFLVFPKVESFFWTTAFLHSF